MSIFIPTFLYIKQHSVTGKMYFGKTKYNPETYLGSGTYWLRHINKHGVNHVVTLWYCLFPDEDECVKFALNFSTQHSITESDKWANLKPENGLDGGPHSDETRLNISRGHAMRSDVEKKQTAEKISNLHKGRQPPLGHAERMSRLHTGKAISDHHKRSIALNNATRVRGGDERMKLAAANRKIYTIVEANTGKNIIVSDLQAWCDTLNISYSMVYRTFTTKRFSKSGYMVVNKSGGTR